jgi:hypothetical protein
VWKAFVDRNIQETTALVSTKALDPVRERLKPFAETIFQQDQYSILMMVLVPPFARERRFMEMQAACGTAQSHSFPFNLRRIASLRPIILELPSFYLIVTVIE